MRKLGIYLAIVLLVLIAAERAVSLPPEFLWAARADARMCAVYRGFYRDTSKYGASVLHAGTARWLPMISLDPKRDAKAGLKEIRFEGWPSSNSRPEIVVDVSTYFSPLMGERSLFIRHCFEGAGGAPFFDGPSALLAIRSLFAARDSWWQLSPVGFSPDGDRALIYVTDTCSGWCGSGMFVLLERRGKDWAIIGTGLSWIA